MFPSQTSLIPATVALVKFFETNGLAAFTQNYPYWYLGSTPYKYLIGPVIPIVEVALHRIVPSVSLFDITIYLVLLSFILSSLGWGFLVALISKNKINGYLVSILLLVLPFRYLSAIALSEASSVIAKNLIPFALLALWGSLGSYGKKSYVVSILATTFLMLINSSILLTLSVGLVAILLASSFDNEKRKFFRLLVYSKRVLYTLTVSLVLVTIWYGGRFWLAILFNPSIGGISTIRVIGRIFELIRAGLPLVLAVIAVYFSSRIKSRLGLFTLAWTLTFVFLSIVRFMGDPDFWMDWTTWLYEVEIGLAIFIAINLQFTIHNLRSNQKINFKRLTLAATSLILPILLTSYVYGLLGKPQLISYKVPEGVMGLSKLNEIVKGTDSRVFLSGSTVFWANALYDLKQVRGGRDNVAIHPTWDKASYELREGYDPELVKRWFDEFKISLVLVHGLDSAEYYHDFKNIEKWEEVGKVLWEESGDTILEY